MYRIIKPDGNVTVTEKPNFIRVHSNGCNILVPREKAQGVAISGVPYWFKDGCVVQEVDAAEVFLTVDEMAAAIREGVNEA